MHKKRYLIVLFLIMGLVLFLSGCSDDDNGDAVAEEEAVDQSNLESLARQSGKDRLPGSLKWEGVELQAAGVDFMDHPEGLRYALAEEEPEEPQPSKPSQPSQPSKPAPQPSSDSGSGPTQPTIDPDRTSGGSVLIGY